MLTVIRNRHWVLGLWYEQSLMNRRLLPFLFHSYANFAGDHRQTFMWPSRRELKWMDNRATQSEWQQRLGRRTRRGCGCPRSMDQASAASDKSCTTFVASKISNFTLLSLSHISEVHNLNGASVVPHLSLSTFHKDPHSSSDKFPAEKSI